MGLILVLKKLDTIITSPTTFNGKLKKEVSRVC